MSEFSTVTFRLPAALREKIKEAADAEDRSEASMIRRLLGEAMAVTEDPADEEGEEP